MLEKLLPSILCLALLGAFAVVHESTEPVISMPPLLHKQCGTCAPKPRPTVSSLPCCTEGFNYDPSAEILPTAIERAEAVPARRVVQWDWRANAEARGRLWNIAETESTEALVAGLHRVCTAEAESHASDCVGIWQTIRAIRNRSCNRARVAEITECYEDGSGETLLSAMRRAQKRVMGMAPPTRQRQVWIANITPTCEEPDGYESRHPWNRDRCLEAAALARRLVTSERPPRLPGGATPIAWGGSFDDHIACSRGLARIPRTGDGDTNTHNTFWCRPGSRGCPLTSDCTTSPTAPLHDLLQELLAGDEISTATPDV